MVDVPDPIYVIAGKEEDVYDKINEYFIRVQSEILERACHSHPDVSEKTTGSLTDKLHTLFYRGEVVAQVREKREGNTIRLDFSESIESVIGK